MAGERWVEQVNHGGYWTSEPQLVRVVLESKGHFSGEVALIVSADWSMLLQSVDAKVFPNTLYLGNYCVVVIVFSHEEPATATPHAFDFVFVVSARADVFPVLLFVPGNRAARAVPVTKLCLVI